MDFERVFFHWILWILAIALALGGKPWNFPARGEYLAHELTLPRAAEGASPAPPIDSNNWKQGPLPQR